MTPTQRPRRSALFLPASNPRAIEKARGLDVDVVILDLEDAVAPEEKVRAREAAVAAVGSGGFGARELVVRVNALGTPWGADDLAAVGRIGADAVLVPKVARGSDLDAYDVALGGATALWVMIETARAVVGAGAIADRAADTRLAAFVLGTNDLALELRAEPGADRAALLPHLAHALAAARSAGLVALDGVRNDFSDVPALAAECAQGRALGFDGKTLIHPAQVAAAHHAFSPGAEALARARDVIAAFADPAHAGKGAIRLGGRMVERLHLADAERLVALDAAIQAREARSAA